MNKIVTLSALALVLGFSGAAVAQTNGGFSGETIAPVSVAEAKNLRDEAPVVMVGKIEKNLGNEKYTFSDATDSVVVEIDNDDWNGLTVGPEDVVEIRGEVDKDFTSFEIDVDAIMKK